MALLEVRGLVKTFGLTRAVNGLSFDVHPGEVFGIVGPDGAGKSTLARLLVGLLDPDTGDITAADVDIRTQADKAREHIGYMPQQYSLYGDLTVAENLRFFADMFFVEESERNSRMERLYQFSRLGPFSDRRADRLSGGMYKKLALMCSMIHKPRLLILDEPTTGVDPLSRRELWEIIYTMVEEEKVGIVVNTPYMDEAERCHRVGMMWEGNFLAIDSPADILGRHPEKIFEIQSDDRDAVLEKLKDNKHITRCYGVGQAVRAAFASDASREEAVLQLYSAGIPEEAVQEVSPSFDDVFMVFKEAGR